MIGLSLLRCWQKQHLIIEPPYRKWVRKFQNCPASRYIKIAKDLIFNTMSSHEQPQTHPEPQHEAQAQKVVETSVNQIEYEDGKVETKVYGTEDNEKVFQAVFHFIERESQKIDSQVVRVEGGLTLEQSAILLEERLKTPLNNIQIKTNLEQNEPFDMKAKASELFAGQTQDVPDVFVYYNAIKAIIKEKEEETKYESLTKYAFIDDKTVVKVYLNLEGIGEVPESNITSRFLERSIEVRIHDYKGKNWVFAVPRTQCHVKVAGCKVTQKKDKLIITIKKVADSDNWFSLHKTKCVGEKGDDI